MIKKLNKKKPESDIRADVLEYQMLREKAGAIKKRMDELSGRIKSYAVNHGTKDDKGSYYSEDNDFVYGSLAKTSVKFNEDKLKKLLMKKKLYDKVIDTKIIINEEKVETFVNEGKISVDELEDVVDKTTNYSLFLSKKEDMEKREEKMPEVQQSCKPLRKTPLHRR